MNRYVFDSGPLIIIFRYYYQQQFPSFWKEFNHIVSSSRVTSTREVYNELEGYEDELANWCKQNKKLFLTPKSDEVEVVKEIFSVKHFQMNISKRNISKGKPVADPFVVARAKLLNCSVVTTEKAAPHGAKVPNICRYFNVDCTNLEGFMEREKWIF